MDWVPIYTEIAGVIVALLIIVVVFKIKEHRDYR
jgi:hypothetical protein